MTLRPVSRPASSVVNYIWQSTLETANRISSVNTHCFHD